MNAYEPPWMSADLPEDVPDGAVWGTFKLYKEDSLDTESMGMFIYIEHERKMFITHGKTAAWVYDVSEYTQGFDKFFGIGRYGLPPYNPPTFEVD